MGIQDQVTNTVGIFGRLVRIEVNWGALRGSTDDVDEYDDATVCDCDCGCHNDDDQDLYEDEYTAQFAEQNPELMSALVHAESMPEAGGWAGIGNVTVLVPDYGVQTGLWLETAEGHFVEIFDHWIRVISEEGRFVLIRSDRADEDGTINWVNGDPDSDIHGDPDEDTDED
jgi:hypothetical protein